MENGRSSKGINVGGGTACQSVQNHSFPKAEVHDLGWESEAHTPLGKRFGDPRVRAASLSS